MRASLLLLLLGLLPWGHAFAAGQSHPFLRITTADVARARDGIRSNPEFARIARDLVRQAEAHRIEALPALDNTWWHGLTNRTWKDCYPENYRHTLELPQRWAQCAAECARASLVEDAPGLAEQGKRALLGLSNYSFEWEHYDTGMFYTIWAGQALDAYDILYNRFTPAERERMDAFFERYLRAVVKNDEYWIRHEPGGKLNNHYAWHKLGRCMIGLFYNRPELVDQALHGPVGVAQMMAHGFKDDGLWLEGAIPYHLTATIPIVIMAEMLENAGYKERLWQGSWAGGPSLKQAYDALFPLLLPDRTLPPIGDAYARRAHMAACPDWEILARRFGDPAYAWLLRDRQVRAAHALFTGLPQLPPGAPPPQLSCLWKTMGYAALRSQEGERYWSGQGWSAFATFSAQPIHQHADKLSILLFAGGHLWLLDREAQTSAAHAFSSAIQSRLNRDTLCHNTLLVDGRSQRHPPRQLDLVEFETTPELKRLTMADTEGLLYPGVRQMRTLVVREDCVLDFFQVRSPEPHDYALLLHVDGQSSGGSLTGWTPVAFPTNAPWSYLMVPSGATAVGDYHENFTNGGRTLRIDQRADGPVEVVRCGFPADDSASPAALQMRMARCRRAEAWFATVFRLDPNARPLDLQVHPRDGRKWQIAFGSGQNRLIFQAPMLDAR